MSIIRQSGLFPSIWIPDLEFVFFSFSGIWFTYLDCVFTFFWLHQDYAGPEREILIDVGTSDNFLKEQLKPENFTSAAEANPKVKVNLRLQVSKKLRPATTVKSAFVVAYLNLDFADAMTCTTLKHNYIQQRANAMNTAMRASL